MDSEFLAALDEDVEVHISEGLISVQPFSPPSLSASQIKQLELLQHLSIYSELLILVCAAKGMGKTFIAKALLASREAPDQSLMLEADFSLSYLDILHNIAQFLDLAELADDVDGIEQQVLSQCLSIAEEEQGSVLLIIDQAEQLSDEVLEDINQLALLAPNALHIMLLAPLGFDESKLITLSEPQAPFHVMEIEPLMEDEAEILLLEQFPETEWSAEQVDYIIQQSVGNPGKILYLAQQLISGVNPPQKAGVITKFPITHLAAILLIASVFIIAYLYQNDSPVLEEGFVDIDDKPALSSQLELPKVSQGVDEKNSAMLVSYKTKQTEEIDFNFQQSGALEKPQIKAESKVLEVKEDVVPQTVLKESSLKKPKIKESAVIVTEQRKLEAFYTKDERSLMSAANSEYVIQVFGSYSTENAEIFMKSNEASNVTFKRYQTLHKGKPWHVVVVGPFESRAVAAKQSKRLADKLRKQNPWVRSISPIQADLKARN